MAGIVIKLWDSSGEEVSVIVPLNIPVEEAAALLGDSLLPSLAGEENAHHVKLICSSILLRNYDFTMGREFCGGVSSILDIFDGKDEPEPDGGVGEPLVERDRTTADLVKRESLPAETLDREGKEKVGVKNESSTANSELAPLRVKIGNTKVVKLMSSKQVYQCDITSCEAQFPFRISLQRHQRAEHAKLFCTTCFKAFESATHVCQRPVSGGKKTVDSSDNKGNLAKKQVYQCDINCGEKFPSKSLLQRHQRQNHAEFFCPTCVRAYLTSHTCHRPHKCDVCGRGFKCRAVLTKHRMIHTGEKPHVCETCGKKCLQIGALRSHQKVHKLRESLPCDQCEATFINEKALQHHKMIHAGQIAHVCDFCSQSFSTRSNLQTHLKRSHLGSGISCPVCNKTFVYKSELTRHMGKHSETRSHVCDICSVAFYHKEYLVKHVRAVHGEKKFICEICKSAYSTSWFLTRHMKSHKDEVKLQKDKLHLSS